MAKRRRAKKHESELRRVATETVGLVEQVVPSEVQIFEAPTNGHVSGDFQIDHRQNGEGSIASQMPPTSESSSQGISIFDALDMPVRLLKRDELPEITSPDLRELIDLTAMGSEFPPALKKRLIENPSITEENIAAAFREGDRRSNTYFAWGKER